LDRRVASRGTRRKAQRTTKGERREEKGWRHLAKTMSLAAGARAFNNERLPPLATAKKRGEGRTKKKAENAAQDH